MKLTPDEARDIVYEDAEDWVQVAGTEETVDNTRWSIIKEAVFKNEKTGKYYCFEWSQGATEQQDERAYEYDKEVEAPEVELKEVTVKKWVKVK